MSQNSVLFKGRNGGIQIVLDENIEFEILKSIFSEKMNDAHKFFDGAKTNIAFSGRVLTDKEELELLSIISAKTELDISFVQDKNAKKDKPPTVQSFMSSMDNMTHFHKGSLRNGQEIRYRGSVVIIGDCNPGSQIIATNNIIVLGALKGIAHAGCEGDESCFVATFVMNPVQLRIAKIITYIPDEYKGKKNSKKKELPPSYAFVQDGRICISPLGE